MEQQQIDRFRGILEQRAGVLNGEVAGMESERADALAMARDDVEDSGDEAESKRDDEVRNAEEDRDRGEADRIVAALARMDDGSYGSCADCGIDIPDARMEAEPTAARCIECQEKVEKRAGLATTYSDPYFAATNQE